MSTCQVKLKRNFDVDRLKKDLVIAEAKFKAASQPGPYHDGSWTGISLKNSKGDAGDTKALNVGRGKDTAVLESCHYFKEILDNIGFRVTVARVLFLPPGKVIEEHCDKGLNLAGGVVRLHIPIITHPDVDFFIEDEKASWQPGEFWFGDFSKPHRLHNRSSITRVHLVMDCRITEESLALFPESFLEQFQGQFEDSILRPINVDEDKLKSFEGFIKLPGKVFGLGIPLLARIDVVESQLRVKLFGFPVSFYFDAIEDKRFNCNSRELEWLSEPGEAQYVRLKTAELKEPVDLPYSKKQSLLGASGAAFQSVVIKSAYLMGAGVMTMIRKMKQIKGNKLRAA